MRKFTLIAVLMLTTMLTACNLAGTSDDDSEAPLLTSTPGAEAEITEESAFTETTRTPFPTQLPIATADTNAQTDSDTDTSVTSQTIDVFAPPQIDPLAADENTFSLQVDGGVHGDGLNLLQVQTMHYAQNPVNRDLYSVIDTSGMLYITGPNGTGAYRIEQSPYTQFPATSLAENNAAARMSEWSTNGQYLAFIVRAEQQASDGVWYFEPGQWGPLQLIVDCPFDGFIGCNIVRPNPNDPTPIRFWVSQDLHWSADSQTILVNTILPEQGRGGIMVMPITRFERVRDERPPILLYDYATWGADGRILASGLDPNGTANISWIDANGTVLENVYPADQNGLWLGWAVERPDGSIVALGGANNTGAVAIYDMDGNAMTAPIGASFPERVVWSPDRSSVIVETQGQQFIASVDGQITNITSSVGNTAINWLQ